MATRPAGYIVQGSWSALTGALFRGTHGESATAPDWRNGAGSRAPWGQRCDSRMSARQDHMGWGDGCGFEIFSTKVRSNGGAAVFSLPF